jgi:hypothetical protein
MSEMDGCDSLSRAVFDRFAVPLLGWCWWDRELDHSGTGLGPFYRSCVDLASILRRFCVDLASILRRFSVDSLSILRRFSVDFASILCRFCVDSLSILRRSCVDSLSTRLTEPLADGHSCSRWANTRPRNFCTVGSIVGFPSAGKHGLKQGSKLVRKGVPTNTPNPENTDIPANTRTDELQNRGQKHH